MLALGSVIVLLIDVGHSLKKPWDVSYQLSTFLLKPIQGSNMACLHKSCEYYDSSTFTVTDTCTFFS